MPQSNNTLSPAPIGTPLLTSNGLLSNPWVLYFQKLYVRLGGGSTQPLSTTNESVGTLQTDVTAVQATQTQQAATLTAQQAAVATVQAGLAVDQAFIAALKQDLPIDSGSWMPTFTAATTSGTVTAQGNWKSIGDELFWDIVVDATGGSIQFAASTCDVPVPALRPGTFAAVSVSTYADHGNGLVSGSTANLPDFTLTGGIAVLSGRYVR